MCHRKKTHQQQQCWGPDVCDSCRYCKIRSILLNVIKYSHGGARSKKKKALFLSYVLDRFQICRRGFANFKVPTNYETRLVFAPIALLPVGCLWQRIQSEKLFFFQSWPIKGHEEQHNLNCDRLAEPWNEQWPL